MGEEKGVSGGLTVVSHLGIKSCSPAGHPKFKQESREPEPLKGPPE